ncbi:MAG TPA: MFS transporter [Pseudonocardiaceae bacterium]
MGYVVPLFLAADALSLLGNMIAAVVLPWLVLVRTGDATAAGTVAAVTALPALLAAVAGGVLIDRVGRRRASIGADLASAVCVAALPVVDAAVGLTLTAFLVLGVAGALFDVPGMTARESLLPAVATRAGIPLERMAGLREALGGTATIAGPAAGGFLLALFDGSTVLWVTAACSATAALLTWLLPAEVGAATPPNPGRRRWLADLREAGAVIRRDPLLTWLTVFTTAGLTVLGPLQGLLLPAHLAATGSAAQLGGVLTALTVGGMLGNGIYAAIGPRWSRRTWFVVCQLGTAGAIAWLAALPSFWWLVTAAVTVGLLSGPLQPILLVVSTERVPDHVRGRVFGLQNAAAMAAVPVGLFGGGLLIDTVGVDRTGTLVAVAWVSLTVVALLAPAVRQLGRSERPGTDTPHETAEVGRADDR